MFKKTLEQYKTEINRHLHQAEKIEGSFSEPQFIKDSYKSAIINMCIKYESLTSELEEIVFKRNPRYNHPWSNTRAIAKNLNIDISKEYKIAHDSWDLYNSLKHINDQTEVEQSKFMKKYEISSFKEAANFVNKALIDLIEVFERS